MATINVSYKIKGTCPPFIVILSGTTNSCICSQILSQTGMTFSMSNLSYSTPYALCVSDNDYLGDPWVCSFTTPALPKVVFTTNTGSTMGTNQCTRSGNIIISPSISGSYTGETSICYCNQITGTPPVIGISRTTLYRNNVLFHNNLATATGTAIDCSMTLPVIIGSGDTLTYELYSCVGSVGTNSLSAISIACTSPITLNTLSNEANMRIGNPSSQSITAYNYVTVAKTECAKRTGRDNSPSTVCCAYGCFCILPTLTGSETMNVHISANTSTIGSSISCVEFYCCGGGVKPIVKTCTVNTNQAAQHVSLQFAIGDIYCYNICGTAPFNGNSAVSRFKITGVTKTGSYTPLISGTLNSDAIAINQIYPTKTIATTRITQASSLTNCRACGSLLISPVLSGSEIMNVSITGKTTVVGGGVSCIEFWCCAGGVVTMAKKCCVCNTAGSTHSIQLPFRVGDIYCYNLCGTAPSYGNSAISSFKITGATCNMGATYIPAVSLTNKADNISIANTTPPLTVSVGAVVNTPNQITITTTVLTGSGTYTQLYCDSPKFTPVGGYADASNWFATNTGISQVTPPARTSVVTYTNGVSGAVWMQTHVIDGITGQQCYGKITLNWVGFINAITYGGVVWQSTPW